MTVYISRSLCDRLRTETDGPIASDNYYLDMDVCYRLKSHPFEQIYYDPRFTDDMKDGCVLAFYPKFLREVYIPGDDRFRFSAKQGIPIYRHEGTYINYRESDFLKCFGLNHRLKH